MDVELYGATPSPIFSYSDDYVYRFIEEAFANCIALTFLLWVFLEEQINNRRDRDYYHPRRDISPSRVQFIKDFVSHQGIGYSNGWDMFERYTIYTYQIEQWMCVKVLFNYELACCLRNFWKDKDFSKIDYVKRVGRDEWFLLKDRNNQYMVMDINTRRWVSRFHRYDYFFFFEDGLCEVRNNHFYGYVDEDGNEIIPCIYTYLTSFKKGICIAKKGEDIYGAIDIHNRIVIPFKYTRKEVDRMLHR